MPDEMNQDGGFEIDLEVVFVTFLRLLRRYWWIIPALALASAAAGLVKNWAFYQPMYQCSASFTVETENTNDVGFGFTYNNSTADQLSEVVPYLLGSSVFTDALKDKIGVDEINGTVAAQVVSGSNLVTMSVTSSSPSEAKMILEGALNVCPDILRYVIGVTRLNMIENPAEPQQPCNQPDIVFVLKRWGLAGAAVSVILLLAGAFLKKNVQKPEELSEDMSLPCLESVPEISRKAHKNPEMAALTGDMEKLPQNFRETFRSLWMRVHRELDKDKSKVLIITSTVAGEGKTMVAGNLAAAAAENGRKVLLIDGDLRKKDKTPESGKVPGLFEVISGKADLEKSIVRDKKRGFYILNSGSVKGNSVQILGRKNVRAIFAMCRKNMDLIIVDTPPCELFSDAALLAEYGDCVLYVTRCDYVEKGRVLEGIRNMEDTGLRLLGYVFNGVPVHHGGYGYYGYGRYGYGSYSQYRYKNYGRKKDEEKEYG